MEAQKIKQVKISKLFGYKDIEWDLNPDVNILSGINGTGKSTVLSIIGELLSGRGLSDRNICLTSKVDILYGDGEEINYLREKTDPVGLTEAMKRSDFTKEIKSDEIKGTLESVKNKNVHICSMFESKEGNQGIIYVGFTRKSSVIPVTIVNTFDQPFKLSEDIKRGADNDEVNTELDLILNKLENEYFRYNANLMNLALEDMRGNKSRKSSASDLLALYITRQTDFHMCVNSFFAQTGKTLYIDEHIYMHYKDTALTPYKLSSGEKQILIILLQVYLQGGQNCIMIMDEPEISLHFEWQKKLIEAIRKLNSNVQLIIATHSPYIGMDGWLDKITNITDITSAAE